MTLKKKSTENIVEKGENASDQHFLLFTQCLLSCPKEISISQSLLSSANTFNLQILLDKSKILSFGEELKLHIA